MGRKRSKWSLYGLSLLHTIFHSLAPKHAPKKQCHACFVRSSARLALPLVGMIPIYIRVRINLTLSVVHIDSAGLATKSMDLGQKWKFHEQPLWQLWIETICSGSHLWHSCAWHRRIKFLRNKFNYNSFD